MSDINRVVVVFSKDRPIQLDLSLSSYFNHCVESYDISSPEVFVIYRTSDIRFEQAYKTLIKEYPAVKFIKEDDFKLNLISCIERKDRVLFFTDDNIVTNHFSLSEMDSLLSQQKKSIGFSLRLGTNTGYCYSMNKYQAIPEILNLHSGKFQDILEYDWTKAELDFNYPLEISSSYYRTEDISEIIKLGDYNNPNFLEWALYKSLKYYKNSMPYIYCYRTSISFCSPLNKVQFTNNNRNSELDHYSAYNLLSRFENRERIDFNKFSGFISNSCHQEVLF